MYQSAPCAGGLPIPKLKAPYRPLANPRHFQQFLNGGGALANRDQLAHTAGYDHNVRKLDFEHHFRALVLLHTTSYRSGHDLAFAAREDVLFQALGADFALSVPGLSYAMKRRPIEPFWTMLEQVMQAVGALPHQRLRGVQSRTWQQITALFEQIDLFDATQIRLPASLAQWADTTPEQSAFKLQLKLDGLPVDGQGRFKEALLTPASGNDNASFSDLLALEEGAGALYLFDCGYFKLARYQEITQSGNYFVTKLHRNIKPEEVAQRPVTTDAAGEHALNAAGYRVLRDTYVRLSGDQAWYRVLQVEVSTGAPITILTNLLWLEAEQVCLLYRYRWKIEIVFRWLKQLLQLDHFISRDPTGVVRQLVVALVVWGLLLLWHGGAGRFSPKQLWRELQAAMHAAIYELGRRHGARASPSQTT